MKRLSAFVFNNIFVFILVLISIILSYLNYVPGTWLIGWDSLHPEFNFWLNIFRNLFGIWRFEQGLGSLAGMSYAADLPRQLILFLF